MQTPKTFLDALDAAEPRPEDAPGGRADKKNYAERLSRHISTLLANRLRGDFPGILPMADGSRQESRARTAKGVKKLDVNYSTPELGLGLGVSIKTVNFRDPRTKRYTKNITRIDNELRAEAKDYHERQPYAVLVAVVFLPADACDDAGRHSASSFGRAVKHYRFRNGRVNPRNEEEQFEKVYVGLYEHAGDDRGDVVFFDVNDAPPKSGRPERPPAFEMDELITRIRGAYDARNDPPFDWAGP